MDEADRNARRERQAAVRQGRAVRKLTAQALDKLDDLDDMPGKHVGESAALREVQVELARALAKLDAIAVSRPAWLPQEVTG